MTCSLSQSHTGSESSSNSRKEMLPKPITIVTSESSSTCFVRSTEEFAYGTGHACTTQTPAQVKDSYCLKVDSGMSVGSMCPQSDKSFYKSTLNTCTHMSREGVDDSKNVMWCNRQQSKKNKSIHMNVLILIMYKNF